MLKWIRDLRDWLAIFGVWLVVCAGNVIIIWALIRATEDELRRRVDAAIERQLKERKDSEDRLLRDWEEIKAKIQKEMEAKEKGAER